MIPIKEFYFTVVLSDETSCVECPVHTTIMYGILSFCPLAMKQIHGGKRPIACPLKAKK